MADQSKCLALSQNLIFLEEKNKLYFWNMASSFRERYICQFIYLFYIFALKIGLILDKAPRIFAEKEASYSGHVFRTYSSDLRAMNGVMDQNIPAVYFSISYSL